MTNQTAGGTGSFRAETPHFYNIPETTIFKTPQSCYVFCCVNETVTIPNEEAVDMAVRDSVDMLIHSQALSDILQDSILDPDAPPVRFAWVYPFAETSEVSHPNIESTASLNDRSGNFQQKISKPLMEVRCVFVGNDWKDSEDSSVRSLGEQFRNPGRKAAHELHALMDTMDLNSDEFELIDQMASEVTGPFPESGANSESPFYDWKKTNDNLTVLPSGTEKPSGKRAAMLFCLDDVEENGDLQISRAIAESLRFLKEDPILVPSILNGLIKGSIEPIKLVWTFPYAKTSRSVIPDPDKLKEATFQAGMPVIPRKVLEALDLKIVLVGDDWESSKNIEIFSMGVFCRTNSKSEMRNIINKTDGLTLYSF